MNVSECVVVLAVTVTLALCLFGCARCFEKIPTEPVTADRLSVVRSK